MFQPSSGVIDYATWRRRFDSPSPIDTLQLRPKARSCEPSVRIGVLIAPCAYSHLVRGSLQSNGYAAWQLTGSARAHDEYPQRLNDLLAWNNYSHVLVVRSPTLLRPHALLSFASAARRNPELNVVYADSDSVARTHEPSTPLFRPDWDPILFAQRDYLGPLLFCNTNWLRSHDIDTQALFEAEFAPLQSTRQDAKVGHISQILGSELSPSRSPEQKPHVPPASAQPGVSVIIPTRNRKDLLEQCVQGVLHQTSYPNIELVVIDNGSDDPATLDYLRLLESRGDAAVTRVPGPFNFSAINNAGVRASTRELLLFLNNDIEVLREDWLSQLVSALDPGVGAVGAKLLYPDESIQHGGVIVGLGGVAGHAFVGLNSKARSYMGLASSRRTVSAVTAACMLVRRSTFERVGGFDENLEVAFNDTDLCLRIGQYERVVYNADAVLRHHESKSRKPDSNPENLSRFRGEIEFMRRRWGSRLTQDPYYNPNLSLEHEYELAAPPRVDRLWQEPWA